jgi:ABC-type transporter Mla subunit MlaD
LDFWIIAALIVLTAVGQVLEIAADKQTRASDLRRDLAFRSVIIEVGLFLHGFRQITPAALKGGLSEAVNQLAQATTAIKDTLLDVREVSSSAADTLANFSRIAVGEFEPAARRLDQIVQSLGSAAETHKGLGDLVRNLQRDMGLSLEKMKEGMDGLGVVLDSRLSDNTVKLEQALRGIIRETEGAAIGLRDAAVAAGEVARVMKKQAEAI